MMDGKEGGDEKSYLADFRCIHIIRDTDLGVGFRVEGDCTDIEAVDNPH
jgi:hypothetical protein